ncbi:flagellin [Bacillaceae bacterium S4-13-56]
MISLIQTAEGALNETHSILQRMRELAVQSANDTNTDTDRAELQKEVDQLAEELTRIADNTEFNTQKLLDGTFEGTFHIGANEGQSLDLSINKMNSLALGVGGNETVTEEVTGQTISSLPDGTVEASVIQAGAKFTVEKLDNTANVGSVNDAQYILKDADGLIVGASADGQTYSFAQDTSSATNDITTTSFGTAQTLNLSSASAVDKITSGTIEFTAASVGTTGADESVTFTASNTLSDSNIKLGSGEYKVADGSTRADVGTTMQVLVNTDTNEVVAVGDSATASQTFTSLDGATTLLTTTSTLATNQLIDVSGQGGIDVSSQTAADAAITTIQSAIDKVSAERSKLGAYQNRLDHTINNLGTSSENLTAAESRIRDVDMAKEMMAFTKNNILSQAAQSMLAQLSNFIKKKLNFLSKMETGRLTW